MILRFLLSFKYVVIMFSIYYIELILKNKNKYKCFCIFSAFRHSLILLSSQSDVRCLWMKTLKEILFIGDIIATIKTILNLRVNFLLKLRLTSNV